MEIAKHLTTKFLGRQFFFFESIDSTNNYLRDNRASLDYGATAIARFQTAGRGRVGRKWETPKDSSLMLSVLLKAPLSSPLLQTLPLAVGIACARALNDRGISAALKWPNDVILQDKKIAGLLCEVFENDYVCGIGVNLTQSEADFIDMGLVNAASIASKTGINVDKGQLAAGILNHLEPLWEHLLAGKEIADIYTPLCMTVGRQVYIEKGGDRIPGVAVRIDDSGALVVHTADGEIAVTSGEVSIRGEKGYV